MVGWHHRLNAREFEQTLGGGEGQGRLECCGPWGHKESDMTELLNNDSNNQSCKPNPECGTFYRKACFFQPVSNINKMEGDGGEATIDL